MLYIDRVEAQWPLRLSLDVGSHVPLHCTASGKLLLADKVLVVAQAAGARLLSEAAWGAAFARATHAVLDKPVIVIDLSLMTISY